MSSESKRQAVVDKGLSRKNKNQYTQGANRTLVGSGYGDCSSTVRWCYQQVLGIDIGINTEAQIKSSKMKDVNVPIDKNGVPEESYLRKGDLFYFRGNDTSRTKGVGHVEMYIGNGNLLGHGSGIGPTEKNMKSYCTGRQYTKGNNGNKGLICVRRVISDSNKPSNVTTNNASSEYYVVKKGDTLSKIAVQFNTTVDNLVILNNIKDKNVINIGQKIYYKSDKNKDTVDYSTILSGYKGNSIVDAFKSKGLDSSFANRKKYAEKVGFTNYTGLDNDNPKLLKLLGANK